jgi:nucleoside-diphosphate-sugar epimerase
MKGDWNYHLDTTITGTKNICSSAEKLGVQNLVYVSTLNVYDAKNYPDGKEINEDFSLEDMPEKRGAYSHAKLIAENFVREFKERSRMNISIFRPGLVYGPGGVDFPGDIGRKMGDKTVLVFGMGNRKIPFVYVDNLVDALVLAKDVDLRGKDAIFNVVDADYPTQRQFIKLYREMTSRKMMAFYVPYWVMLGGFWLIETLVGLIFKKKVSLRYKLKCIMRNPVHSTKKAQDVLGWRQKVDFQEGLERTIQEQKSETI